MEGIRFAAGYGEGCPRDVLEAVARFAGVHFQTRDAPIMDCEIHANTESDEGAARLRANYSTRSSPEASSRSTNGAMAAPVTPPSNRAMQPPRSWSDVVKEKNACVNGNPGGPPNTPTKPAVSESQLMQHTISAAINAAMTPLIAQMEMLKKDIVDMQNAEMELEDEVVSESSTPAASTATEKTRKLKLIKSGAR